LVEKSGSWFSFAGERIGQGRENARSFLLANPEIRERLDSDLRKKLGFETQAGQEEAGKDEAGKKAGSAQLPLNHKAAQSA
jgi:recombination protein RecA